MAGIGHNGGPEMTGVAWRTHCWKKAREALLPHLPIEVIRRRVARAAELGLDYKTYAGVRDSTGHDVVAFLFSSNGLRPDAMARIQPDRAARLEGLRKVQRISLAQGVSPDRLLAANPVALDDASPAPRPFGRFPELRQTLRESLGDIPGSRVVLVSSDAPWESEWLVAGRLGTIMSEADFFSRVAAAG